MGAPLSLPPQLTAGPSNFFPAAPVFVPLPPACLWVTGTGTSGPAVCSQAGVGVAGAPVSWCEDSQEDVPHPLTLLLSTRQAGSPQAAILTLALLKGYLPTAETQLVVTNLPSSIIASAASHGVLATTYAHIDKVSSHQL